MSIKLITVDMNGIFLGDRKTYNREHFMAQYRQVKGRGIRFMVANDNQYYQLVFLFPELANEVSFVAENGGWVVSEEEDVFNGELTRGDFRAIIDHLLTRADIGIIARGRNSTYTLKQYSDKRKDVSAMYYHRLEFVDNFDDLNDVFFRSGPSISDDRVPQMQTDPHETIDDIMVPMHIGYGSIGLVIPGVHEANGLCLLQQRWSINDDEVVVLNDGGNDIGMLYQAGFSFAMTNIHKPMIEAAKYRTGSSNEERVLDIIDRILKNKTPFMHQRLNTGSNRMMARSIHNLPQANPLDYYFQWIFQASES